jgi:serine/threonine protein kinase
MTEESLFHEALARPPQERAAFVEAACASQPELRAAVEALLAAHEQPGSLLDSPALQGATSDAAPGGSGGQTGLPASEGPGSRIGPYKLLQQIGEGGMGVVYLAEQEQPVRRRVALKIIKPGMDSRQVIARFEAERQALALMDHQNIARVLDAGTTDSGRPYFVMELVKGVPITKFCDEQHLTSRERLELFIPVCQAIQHAHQKGIIHRDLKPSNVLVALYDGKPVPKVIDFGVAKAIEQRLTERTLFTQLGQVVGTLEYMSPEQAELNQLEIDTRSDIYSLGVLLYELLTGTTPLERQRLRSAAFTEMLRMIREEEPPRPSTRLSASGDKLPTISAQRKTEPAKLTRLVRGELDWIVMKALEKDRARRYETANGFARDIERYLADEPVSACPPSAAYRLGKFLRRHKGPVLAAALVFCALLAGMAGTTLGLLGAEARRQEAERPGRRGRATPPGAGERSAGATGGRGGEAGEGARGGPAGEGGKGPGPRPAGAGRHDFVGDGGLADHAGCHQ